MRKRKYVTGGADYAPPPTLNMVKNVRIEDATFLGPVNSVWIALQLTLLDQFHQNNRRGVLFLFTFLKKMS